MTLREVRRAEVFAAGAFVVFSGGVGAGGGVGSGRLEGAGEVTGAVGGGAVGVATVFSEKPMSDNRRRYSTLQKALKSLRATEPKGNLARHLNTSPYAAELFRRLRYDDGLKGAMKVFEKSPKPAKSSGHFCLGSGI